jgi:Smg protein
MFEVLVYVYENYWQGDACPQLDHLGRKLIAAGFDADEIEEALVWLNGLNIAAQSTQIALPDAPLLAPLTLAKSLPHLAVLSDLSASLASNPTSCALAASSACVAQSKHSLRVYSIAEQTHLGADCLGFVYFLEASGVLPPHMREIVIDRAMAAPGEPVLLDDLKIIVLMVYWSFGHEPEALVLDELCDDAADRVAH